MNSQNYSINQESASTQTKFAHLLEDQIGKPILENQCSMHLGVNLCVAQVKAAARIGVHDAELESAVDMAEIWQNAQMMIVMTLFTPKTMKTTVLEAMRILSYFRLDTLQVCKEFYSDVPR